MLLFPLVLLFGATSAFHFELDGHYALIPAADAKSAKNDYEIFLKSEEQLKNKLLSLFSERFEEFFVKKFEIHGEDIHPTAIFTAFLTTELPKERIIEIIAKDDHLDVFRIKELGSLPARPTAPSVKAYADFCLNGGFLMPNNTCACPAFFTGDSCEIVNCLHGGIADNGRCACPPGVYAVNCEQRGCLPQVQDNMNTLKQSFILVLNQRSTMSYIINQVAIQLGDVFKLYNGINLYANYILVNYVKGKNGLLMSKNVFDTPDALVDYLNTLVFATTGDVRQPTNRAILEAQSFVPSMKALSNIFVFADTLDSEAGPRNDSLSSNSIETQLIMKTLAWRNRIIYYLASPPVQANIVDDDSYQVFLRVSRANFGDLINFNMTEIDTIIHTIPSYQQNENLAVWYFVSNQRQVNVSVYTGEGGTTGAQMMVLLTSVIGGKMPKITDSFRDQMSIIKSGSQFTLFESTTTNKVLHVHEGNQWNLRVWIFSRYTPVTAFAYDPKVDVGTAYTPGDYHVVISGTLLGSTSQPTNFTTLWLDPKDGDPYSHLETVGTKRKDECSYDWQFATEKLYCIPGPFAQLMTMKTTFGQTIQRIIPGYCVDESYQSSRFVCLNGGTRKGTSSCACPHNYSGTQCEIPKCLYGGSPNKFPGNGQPLCICPAGYSGDFCDQFLCETPTQNPPPFSSHSTLAVVLQNSISQSQISQSIDSGISNLVNAMAGQDEYHHFVLTTFHYLKAGNQVQEDINTTVYSNTADFQKAVNDVQYLPTPAKTQGVLQAILNAFSSFNIYRSPMFVFVDSEPSNTEVEQDAVSTAVIQNVRFTIVVTPPYGMQSMCMSTKGQQYYQSLADKTGGVFINLCQTYYGTYDDPISQLFVGFGLAHHRTESLNEVVTPPKATYYPVFYYIDRPQNDAFLIVNCPVTENFTVEVFNEDLKVHTNLTALTNMPYFAVYKLTPTAFNTHGYSATFQKGDGTQYGSCLLQAVTKSNESTYMSFAQDPSFDANLQQLQYVVAANPVLHINSDRVNNSTLLPTLLSDDADESFTYMSAGYMRNNSCAYEYYFLTPFTCNKPGDSYVLRLEKTNTDGTTYMRSLRGYCFLENGKCAHGGYKLSNGQCKCPVDYGGVLCQTPRCRNGGRVSGQYTCDCDYKHTGKFCEKLKCNDWNFMESVDPRNNNFKQITFILNRNLDSLYVNVQLATLIQSIVDQTESPSLPIMYTLITFDNIGVTRVISTSHAQQFVNSFKSFVNTPGQSPVAYETKSVDAIVEALKLNIAPPGVIYLFTGQEAMAPTPGLVDNYLQQKIDTQVNIFYTKNGVTYPQLPGETTETTLMQMVKQSGGRFLPITQNSVGQLENLIVSSTKQHGLIMDAGYKDCKSGVLFNFAVEMQFRTIEITITGVDVFVPGKVALKDPNGVLTTADSIVFQDNGVLVLTYASNITSGGDWWLQIETSVGACSAQVRVDSDIRLYPGFTVDQFDDFVHQVPFTGLGLNRSTFMTFHLLDDDFTATGENTVNLQRLDVYSADFSVVGMNTVHVDKLYLTQRDTSTCAYQFVTSEWTVNANPQQMFIVTGQDRNSNDFQRTFFYTFPTFGDRSSTCFHGKRDDWGQCECLPSWNGDYCQNPICQNGGTSSYGICICLNGFFGPFCDFLNT